MPRTGPSLERRSTSAKENNISRNWTTGPGSTAMLSHKVLSSNKGSIAGTEELWQLLDGREAQLQQVDHA